MIITGYLQADRTADGDECLTPRYVVEPIIKYLAQKNYKKIWCPFDTVDSYYVRSLRKHGFYVVHTHISDGNDFFRFDYKKIEFDCIVSNPPFSLKDKVFGRLYAINKPFAVLLPQNALQSVYRTKLFIKYGLEYLGFDKRASFYTANNLETLSLCNHFASGYFCKNVLPEKLIFEILQPIQENYYGTSCTNGCEQLSLFQC